MGLLERRHKCSATPIYVFANFNQKPLPEKSMRRVMRNMGVRVRRSTVSEVRFAIGLAIRPTSNGKQSKNVSPIRLGMARSEPIGDPTP